VRLSAAADLYFSLFLAPSPGELAPQRLRGFSSDRLLDARFGLRRLRPITNPSSLISCPLWGKCPQDEGGLGGLVACLVPCPTAGIGGCAEESRPRPGGGLMTERCAEESGARPSGRLHTDISQSH